MRVGFALGKIGPIGTADNIVRIAQHAEALRYDSLWTVERLLWPVTPQSPDPGTADGSLPVEYKHVLAPLEAMTFVAAHTQRIALGTSVLDIPHWVSGSSRAKTDLRSQWKAEETVYKCHSEKYHAVGARIPRGVLLVGPPGTGKTIPARAVAGGVGVPFVGLSASELVQMFVGVGASRVRDLFAHAKAAAPSIALIDELDAVGRRRGAGVGATNDEREQTLNKLLAEMDGFDDR
jgi:hypothetical protein